MGTRERAGRSVKWRLFPGARSRAASNPSDMQFAAHERVHRHEPTFTHMIKKCLACRFLHQMMGLTIVSNENGGIA